MKIDINNIPYDDKATWELIQSGYTCAMFQCESPLVQVWLRKIKPKNLWELSAVVAAVRPGVLKSGYTERYANNKSRGESETFGHSIVDDIFKETHGVLLYQEQLMQLGGRLAWCHLEDKARLVKVDQLRKAVGKKNQQKIIEIGKEFVDGCTLNKIDPVLSESLFEVIKNSGRYAFNLSHSFKYGCIAYKTAYLKTHYPLQTFATYLTYAKEKIDNWEEIDKLHHDAKIFYIDLLPPNINKKNHNFSIENGAIRYGLSHIKYGINRKYFEDVIRRLPIINHWHQFIMLTHSKLFGDCMRKNTVESLVGVGAFSDIGLTRKTLINLYRLITELTPKELEVVLEKLPECPDINNFGQFLQTLFEHKPDKRKLAIKSAVAFFKIEPDLPAGIAKLEKYYLGTVITATSLEGKKITTSDTCLDCMGDWPIKSRKTISAVVEELVPKVTKKGKNPGESMALITIKDLTAQLNGVPVFPQEYAMYSDLLIENNTIELDLERGKQGWVVKRVKQIH